MTVALYTQATLDALNKGLSPEKVLEGLKGALANRGHETLYPKVLKAVTLRLKKADADRVATIKVAVLGDEKQYHEAIEAFLKEANATTHVVSQDETIIGGFVAQTNTLRRDQSYKESLLSIYRSVINHK